MSFRSPFPVRPGTRRGSRRTVARVAVATAALVALAACSSGGGSDDAGPTTITTAATTATTTPPTTGGSTTAPTATTPTTTAPSSPGTVRPVTRQEMIDLVLPFSAGIEAMPSACRDYWRSQGGDTSPFGGTDNVLGYSSGADADRDGAPDNLAIADADGDGVADGIAAYYCRTNGSMAPTLVVVLPAATRRPVTTDNAAMLAAAKAFTGDERFRFNASVGVVPSGEAHAGEVYALFEGFVPGNPNAQGSRMGWVSFPFDRDGLVPGAALAVDEG